MEIVPVEIRGAEKGDQTIDQAIKAHRYLLARTLAYACIQDMQPNLQRCAGQQESWFVPIHCHICEGPADLWCHGRFESNALSDRETIRRVSWMLDLIGLTDNDGPSALCDLRTGERYMVVSDAPPCQRLLRVHYGNCSILLAG